MALSQQLHATVSLNVNGILHVKQVCSINTTDNMFNSSDGFEATMIAKCTVDLEIQQHGDI